MFHSFIEQNKNEELWLLVLIYVNNLLFYQLLYKNAFLRTKNSNTIEV